MNRKFPVRACAFFIAAVAATTSMISFAVDPVVVWDGAAADYDFSTLTRVVGDNTYTLNLNAQNTVGENGAYIQIGSSDAQAGVTLTVQNSNPSVTNGFGTAGAVTIIMKCSNAPVDAGLNRALISLLDNKKYDGGSVGSDNSVKIGVSHWLHEAYFIWQGGYWSDSKSVNDKFTAAKNIVALAYSSSNGTAFYLNGEQINYRSDLKSDVFTAPCGIALGGVDTDGSSKYAALKGMKIEAVAVFTSTLSLAEVQEFRFPSIWASEVNAWYGSKTEITLDVADGTCVIGDTTFNATNINFTCNGSLAIFPPSGNTAEFDFSGVVGDAVVSYAGSLPTVSGNTFTSTTVPTWVTDSSKWADTIALSGMAITGPNFNNYGNSGSAVRLSGVTGWINTGTDYTTPIVLDNGTYGFGLKLNNGNSPQSSGINTNRCSVFAKISGSGSFVDDGINEGSADIPQPVIKVYDFSGFSGNIALKRASMVVCDASTDFGNTLYNLFVANNGYGSVYIAEGKSAILAEGRTWTVRNFTSYGNPTVNGTLTASASETFQGSVVGSGSIVASGFLPAMSVSPNIDLDNWTGTFALSYIKDAYPFNVHLFCGTNSTLELTSVGTNSAYLAGGVKVGKVVLTDDGETDALALSDGLSDECTIFAELAGTGTISQSKGTIFQGLTINVMTNFTGTLSLNNMSVTFGTAQRMRKSGLYIDSDAVVSVPAGFMLWAPENGVVFNGTVNFTTDRADYNGLVLFNNIGPRSNVRFGANAVIRINGEEYDRSRYVVKVRNSNLMLVNRRLFTIHVR